MRTEAIKLSQFLEIWNSADGKFLQKFIDNNNMLKVNYTFAYENFTPELTFLPTTPDGRAAFTVQVEAANPDSMAHYKAALGRNIGFDYAGLSGYSGYVTPSGRALNPMNVSDIEDWEKIEEQLGNAVEVVRTWMPKLQQLQNTMDGLASNQAAQLLSTGRIVGLNSDSEEPLYLQDARVASENRVKGGAKAWTAPDADILVLMKAIEDGYRDRTGDEQPLKWQIKLSMWRNVFLTNAKLKQDVVEYRKMRELPYSNNGVVLEDWVLAFINSLGATSPIEIVKEGEIKQDPINGGYYDLRKDVEGWADNIAILRPIGMAGTIKKGEILKAKWLSNPKYTGGSTKNNVAYMQGGLYALIASTVYDSNGLATFHTDIEGNFAPALTCAPFLTIVDTSQAD